MADPFQTNKTLSRFQRSYLLSSYGQLPQHPVPPEYCALWCLFLGDKEPFKVALPLNVDVDDLKELIHIKGIDTTKSNVLSEFLWKDGR
jgi:hypothetical protein